MTRQEAFIQKADALKKHPDCIVLCRVDNYYESYDMDAVELNRACGLYVANRNDGDGLVAGFAHHKLDCYLPKLVRAGNRVIILE